jgi:hypothetical protein
MAIAEMTMATIIRTIEVRGLSIIARGGRRYRARLLDNPGQKLDRRLLEGDKLQLAVCDCYLAAADFR